MQDEQDHIPCSVRFFILFIYIFYTVLFIFIIYFDFSSSHTHSDLHGLMLYLGMKLTGCLTWVSVSAPFFFLSVSSCILSCTLLFFLQQVHCLQIYLEPQVRSIVGQIRPDRQSNYSLPLLLSIFSFNFSLVHIY